MKTMMQPRQGEKRRYDDMIMDAREEAGETLCRLGDGSPADHPMETDKRMRREIANSNERRRMQSINAGFSQLKTLLPNAGGDKLSKAAILQQTSEYIELLSRENTQLKLVNKKLKKMVHRDSPDSSSSEGGDVTDLMSTIQDMRHHNKSELPNTEFHTQPYAKKMKYDDSPRIVASNTPPHRLSANSPHMVPNSPSHLMASDTPPHVSRKSFDEGVLPRDLEDKEEKYLLGAEDETVVREVVNYTSSGRNMGYTEVYNSRSHNPVAYTNVASLIKREPQTELAFNKAVMPQRNSGPRTHFVVVEQQASPHNTYVGAGQNGRGQCYGMVSRLPTPSYTSTVVEPSSVEMCGPHPHIPPQPALHPAKGRATPIKPGSKSLNTIVEAIRHLEGENFHSALHSSRDEKIEEEEIQPFVYEEVQDTHDQRSEPERRIVIDAYDAQQSEDVQRAQQQSVHLEAYEADEQRQHIRLEAYDAEQQPMSDGYESQPEQQNLLISNVYNSSVDSLRASPPIVNNHHSPRYEMSTGSSTSVVHASTAPHITHATNQLTYHHIQEQEAPLELTTTRGTARSSSLSNTYESFPEHTNVIVIGQK